MPGVKSITRDRLEAFKKNEAKRKELSRQSRTIDQEQAQIKSDVLAALQHDDKTSATRFGFALSIVEGVASVRWKDAFIRENGSEAANRLIAAAAPKFTASIGIPE